jgi:hypothetical protein
MDIHALLVIEFDDAVDRISRAMFAERLESFDFLRQGAVSGCWSIEFTDTRTSRQSALEHINNCINLACERGRFARAQLRGVVQLGNEPPIQVRPA